MEYGNVLYYYYYHYYYYYYYHYYSHRLGHMKGVIVLLVYRLRLTCLGSRRVVATTTTTTTRTAWDT